MAAAAALSVAPAQAAEQRAGARAAERQAPSESPSADEVLDPKNIEVEATPSAAAERVLQWVNASGDNGDLPYMVIDKNEGRLFLFDAEGQPAGQAPVLIGIATGDDSTPGVGSKRLSQLGPAEKTTPAGRFLAKFGRAAGNQQVLWVDYATSVALHAVVTGNKRERRLERLASASPEDKRITYGCINVPVDFYEDTVRPLFRKEGGIVYVLPDTKPLEEVFPRVQLLPYL
jgi:hypothetical protein